MEENKRVFILFTKTYTEHGSDFLWLNVDDEDYDIKLDNYCLSSCEEKNEFIPYILCKEDTGKFFQDFFNSKDGFIDVESPKIEELNRFVNEFREKTQLQQNELILSCHFPSKNNSREGYFELTKLLNKKLREAEINNTYFSFFSSNFMPRNSESVDKFFRQMVCVAHGKKIMFKLCDEHPINGTKDELKEDNFSDEQINELITCIQMFENIKETLNIELFI
jgi:hypothetical protein